MKKEIFKRVAAICFALAAAGFYLWLSYVFSSPDVAICSIGVFLVVAGVCWPMRPLALARTRTPARLPHPDFTPLGGQNPDLEDGRRGIWVDSGEVEDA